MSVPGDSSAERVPVRLPSHLVICGKGRIATSGLSFAVHHLATQGLSIPVVASPNADDRGYDTWQPSLIRAAAQLGVECVDLATLEQLPGLLLVSLEYDRIIRVDRFASSRLFNIHFSALPRYRGVYTSMWPILNDEREVGVTLHYMDRGVDTGPVVAQRRMPLPASATSRRLYDLFLDEGLDLFREWLPRLVAGVPAAVPQDEAAGTTFNRKSLSVREVAVDLTRDAADVCRFVRAYSFPEYQLPTVGGRGIRSCARLAGTTSEPPGTPLHVTPFSTSFAVGGGGMVEMIWA